MTHDPQHQPSPTALLRYQVVSQVRALLLGGCLTLAAAIRKVIQWPHFDHCGRRVSLSERSTYRWVAVYERDGLRGLEPQPRGGVEGSAVLSTKLLAFLEQQKKLDEQASVPELVKRARRAGVISEDEPVSRTSVWRACCRLGLPLVRTRRLKDKDMRRFAYPHRMMMVLADGKHFRAGRQRLKRVAIHFLDDATRFGLGVMVSTSENTVLFLRTLRQVIRSFGLMKVLFLDNGPGFISEDTHTAVARLGVHLVHGTVAYPEGHGKVERFHRTENEQCLRGLDANPEVDPDPAALTLRLSHWLQEVYNHESHESLGGASPAERFFADRRDLEMPEDHAWLDACFQTSVERTVSKDNVVRCDGQAYELPLGHAGTVVRLTRHLTHGTLFVRHQGRQVRLHPVDLKANAYSRRAHPAQQGVPDRPAPVQTAADMHYLADFAPLVGPDGNFPKGDPDDQENP
ncbi:MAG: transposase [bacterium]|nr:transposase [bacterium]